MLAAIHSSRTQENRRITIPHNATSKVINPLPYLGRTMMVVGLDTAKERRVRRMFKEVGGSRGGEPSNSKLLVASLLLVAMPFVAKFLVASCYW